MAKSKTKIDEQMQRKHNPELVETLMKAKKNDKWLEVAGLLSMPRRLMAEKNLDEIDKESKEGDTIVIAGKVLGNGDISKKIKISALSFSHEAEKKLKAKKCEMLSLIKEIETNKKAEGIKILKWIKNSRWDKKK